MYQVCVGGVVQEAFDTKRLLSRLLVAVRASPIPPLSPPGDPPPLPVSHGMETHPPFDASTPRTFVRRYICIYCCLFFEAFGLSTAQS